MLIQRLDGSLFGSGCQWQQSLLECWSEIERGGFNSERREDIFLAEITFNGCICCQRNITHKYSSRVFLDNRSTMNPAQSVEKPYPTAGRQVQID
jgi:hypothetical protein